MKDLPARTVNRLTERLGCFKSVIEILAVMKRAILIQSSIIIIIIKLPDRVVLAGIGWNRRCVWVRVRMSGLGNINGCRKYSSSVK